jgi:hypothetical protein
MSVYMVVDTNALPYKKGNIASDFWNTVLALCGLKNIKPAISEVVLDETVNIMHETAATLIEQFVSAHSGLGRFIELAPIYAPESDEIAGNYEAMLRARFQILPLDGQHAREALRREARRVAPASDGRGARDSAIWLTVVNLVHNGHEVHFITNNSEDFGKGTLRPELLVEIAGKEQMVSYHVDVNAFLDQIALKIGAPSIPDDELKDAFDASLRSSILARMGGFADDVDKWWSVLTDDYKLTGVQIVQAYKVDDRGLARVSATFDFGTLAGAYTGWLGFDPVSGIASISEIDDISGLAAS